jgi:hypothetical protein
MSKKSDSQYSRRDYVFRGDLLNKPVTVSTIWTEQGFMCILETLPVLTIRGGAYSRDILEVSPTKKQAIKFHKDTLKRIAERYKKQ